LTDLVKKVNFLRLRYWLPEEKFQEARNRLFQIEDSVSIRDKLEILSAAAEQDVCSPRTRAVRGEPSYSKKRCLPGIYPALLPDGKIINLFKVLLTNRCELNCLYCANRKNRNLIRDEFTPQSLSQTFIQYLQKDFVQGLFLSSAIKDNSQRTMDKMLETCIILRKKYRYPGYIHLKVLPGSTPEQMEKAVELANRVSLNLEAPNSERLKRLSPQKISFSLLENLKTLTKVAEKYNQRLMTNGQRLNKTVSTQLVVGPGGETDKEIVYLTEELHQKYNLRRVYFSAFVPISDTPLENFSPTPLLREHRLYQVDWLIHFYGFKAKEIPLDEMNNLLLDKDPKLLWAESDSNKHLFPIEINRADYYQLLRIPGIGPVSAKRILEYRQKNKIHNLQELKSLGAVIKRTAKFILLDGKRTEVLEKKIPSSELLLPLNL
jgi:putative DNA modification/repair radical SAM protein